MNDEVQNIFEAEFDLKKNTIQTVLGMYKSIDKFILKILSQHDEDDQVIIKVDQFNKKVFVSVKILDRIIN
jgi:hypothetical protein